jgi:DNA invertase Pin-like site-specific DNA recombinase
MRIGYARVSTDDQNLDLQRQALAAAGCDQVIEDKGFSGSDRDRPGLASVLGALGPGDVLVVWKLDRLGRSLRHLIELVDTLRGRGIGLQVLTGQGAAIDTTRPEGRLVFGIFAALAEFERELIIERTREGMKAAKRRGKHVGRPRKLSPHQVAHARALLATGGETQAGVAALLGVDVSTVRRVLKT